MLVQIRDPGDLKRVARDLRRHASAPALRKELRRGLREATKPVVQQARAAYRGAPSKGGVRRGRPPLRRALARATSAQIKPGAAVVAVKTDGKRMPSGMGRLPAMWEGLARWRHPVYGNREVWVSQQARRTFYPAVLPASRGVRARIEQVADDIVAKIT